MIASQNNKNLKERMLTKAFTDTEDVSYQLVTVHTYQTQPEAFTNQYAEKSNFVQGHLAHTNILNVYNWFWQC